MNDLLNRREMLLMVSDMIEASLLTDDKVNDDLLTYCQFFMQQDMSYYTKEDLLKFAGFIREKAKAPDSEINDEYLIREVLEKDVETIVHPEKETFLDRNTFIIRDVLDKKGIKYIQRRPGFDVVLFEIITGADEDFSDSFRAEVILDRVEKLCIFRKKSDKGKLLAQEKMLITDTIIADRFNLTFDRIYKL